MTFDYLDVIGAGLIILDSEPFSFDYVPEQLVGRDEILREMALKFSPVITANGSGKAVLSGPVGTGKTSVAKRFCRDLQTKFEASRKIKVCPHKLQKSFYSNASFTQNSLSIRRRTSRQRTGNGRIALFD